MARLQGKGIDAVTVAHKLVGVAWLVGAVGSLVFVFLPGGTGGVDWARVATLQTVAAVSSVATLVVAVVYGLFTGWGFLRFRWMIVKWALFLVATGFGGPAISAARSHVASVVIGLTAAEIVALLLCGALGVFLELARHSGRLAVT